MPKRKPGQKTVRQGVAHYRAFFTHALEGLFRSTPAGCFTEVNPALVRMLGYESAEEVLALQLPDALYVDPAQRTHLRANYEPRGALEGVESLWKKKSGEPIVVSLYARTIHDARGHTIAYEGMVLDITAQKRSEAALKASEAKYRTIFATSPDFIYLTDLAGKLLEANSALLEWQGLSLAALQQRHFLDFLAGDNRAEVVQAFAALQQGRPINGLEVRARNVRGEIREFEVNATPLPQHEGGMVILSMARDITARKQAEEQLRLLSRQLLEIQETERRHLARELHDEIGQKLAALIINLQALHPVPKRAAPYLQESLRIVGFTMQQVRNLSLDLRPVQLDNLGLVATLQWYVERQTERTELALHFDADRLRPRPHPTLETTCFRLVQEALSNIARHAQARQVWVELRQHAAALHLFIRDDGIGFDLREAQRQAAQGKVLGLLGIEERVRLAGGQLKIVTASGQGTEIRARLPLRHRSVRR